MNKYVENYKGTIALLPNSAHGAKQIILIQGISAAALVSVKLGVRGGVRKFLGD